MKLSISRAEVEIDQEDYDYIKQFTYSLTTQGYAMRTIAGTSSRRKNIPLANDIMRHELLEAPSNVVVDHIDQNKLNCRRSNLRLATPAQNTQNAQNAIRSVGPSGYRGVSRYEDKRRKKPPCWKVVIKVNSVSVFIGYYNDKVEAARAYDKAAKLYHKQYAVLNFPEEV